MSKTEPRTLAGFMELMPNEQILFEQIKQKIEKTYQNLVIFKKYVVISQVVSSSKSFYTT